MIELYQYSFFNKDVSLDSVYAGIGSNGEKAENVGLEVAKGHSLPEFITS